MTMSLTVHLICVRYLIYAQGLPLVITLIVLTVDKVGQKNVEKMEDQRYLPNMGIYSCFISNGSLGFRNYYFAQPIFIYLQSFMLVEIRSNLTLYNYVTLFLFKILQGTNMYFLGSTIIIIRKAFGVKHDRTEDDENKYKLYKREFNIIAKLSVIMGNFENFNSINN